MTNCNYLIAAYLYRDELTVANSITKGRNRNLTLGSMDANRTLILDVHMGGHLVRAEGLLRLHTTHTYKGATVHRWKIRRGDLGLWRLLGALANLNHYGQDATFFFEAIQEGGPRYLRALQTQTDIDALAAIGETEAGIPIYIVNGIPDVGALKGRMPGASYAASNV